MNVAFGFKAHSGWAALVVLGEDRSGLTVVDRRRVELVDAAWAKAPYHAAEEMEPEAARRLVKRGIESAHRVTDREVRAAAARERAKGNEVAACGVLVSEPMPDWTTDEIRAVHFRMHKAEGVLFKDALLRAARACGLQTVAIPEKRMEEHAAKALGASWRATAATIAGLGKSVGPPWAKDQRDAALAAAVAWHGRAT